jgi:DNA-binding response OmpR family regulator
VNNNLPNNKVGAASVLLVEDSPAQALRFKTALEDNSYDVLVAENGLDGVEAAHKERFDLIVLDIELPDINGFEVCRRLKSDPIVASVPIIMLTTRDRAEDALTGLETGAIDYIPKDAFAEAVLLETLRQMGL